MNDFDRHVTGSDSAEKAAKVEIKGTMAERPNKGIVVKSRIRAGGVNPWKV